MSTSVYPSAPIKEGELSEIDINEGEQSILDIEGQETYDAVSDNETDGEQPKTERKVDNLTHSQLDQIEEEPKVKTLSCRSYACISIWVAGSLALCIWLGFVAHHNLIERHTWQTVSASVTFDSTSMDATIVSGSCSCSAPCIQNSCDSIAASLYQTCTASLQLNYHYTMTYENLYLKYKTTEEIRDTHMNVYIPYHKDFISVTDEGEPLRKGFGLSIYGIVNLFVVLIMIIFGAKHN